MPCRLPESSAANLHGRRGRAGTDPGPAAELCLHQRGEMFSSLRIRGVPVETGAPRRKDDGVARGGQAGGGVDRRAHRRAPGGRAPGRRMPSPPRRRTLPPPPRPARGGRVPARSDRSRPLLRPPAISTTEREAPHSGCTAAGVVALESSYQETPSFLGHELDPVGGHRVCRAPPHEHPLSVAPAARATARAAAVLARSCGKDLGRSAGSRTNPPGPSIPSSSSEPVPDGTAPGGRMPSSDAAGAKPKRNDIDSSGHALGRSPDHRVIGVDDRCAAGALLGPYLRLGPGVMVEVRVPVEVVGGEVEPAAYVRAELPGELELERGHLGHQHRALARGQRGRPPPATGTRRCRPRPRPSRAPAWRSPVRSPSSSRWCR